MRITTAARRLLLAAALLLPVAANAEDPLDAAAAKEVTAAEAKKVAMHLAGPKFLGRGTGQKGNREAALWLAGELKEAGFDPGPARGGGPDGKVQATDFLQEFPVAPANIRGATGVSTANVVGVLARSGAASGSSASPAGDAAPGEGETVVLGAHYDHMGVQGGVDPKKPPKKSGVFWGADDNASGSTAMLLIARTVARLRREHAPMRRNLVVIFFGAEEIGLLGSKHYVTHPVLPLSDTVAMLNIDMIGRNAAKYVEVYGNGTSPELDAWHRQALLKSKLECNYSPNDVFHRSDQFHFYEAGIPAMFLFGGFHKDYHTVRDVPEALNFPKIEAVARHMLEILWQALQSEKRPTFRKIDLSSAGGKLGLSVDPATPEEEEPLRLEDGKAALRVAAVFAGSMGEKHFQVGDLVTHWNGISFEDDDPVGKFNAFVTAARQGDRITIRYARGKERKAALVQF